MFRTLYCLAVVNFMLSPIKTDSCGQVNIVHNGTITSPDFPAAYPRRASCVWNFTAPLGDVVRLSFQTFCVEKGKGHGCPYDRVSIIINLSNKTDLCGCDRRPMDVRAEFTSLAVMFSSDDSIAMAGFNLSVWFEKGIYPDNETTSDMEQETTQNLTTAEEFVSLAESRSPVSFAGSLSSSTTVKVEETSTDFTLASTTTRTLTEAELTSRPLQSTPYSRESRPNLTQRSGESGGMNVFVFFIAEVLVLGAVYFYLQYRTGQDEQFVRQLEQKLDQQL
ncbi:Zinc metalloproteinase nas-39 [Bulinus truncatus]|nr:Zinc metalloproteinase nas-39 [Bulinus truncatus]